MPRLLVNADDYGLTPGVNHGIEDAFAAGGVTSATLMASAPQARAAAEFVQRNLTLAIGCHVVLVDGAPLSDPEKVASLLAPQTQMFYSTPARFLIALLAGKVRQEQLILEIGEQLQRIRNLGIQPTHVDTHKHLHMFPAVAASLLTSAREHGISVIRNPFEPAWGVASSSDARLARKVEVSLLRRLYAARFRKLAEQYEFATTDGTIGVAATGSLSASTLARLLNAMPEGTWELVCHPGYVDDELRSQKTRLLASRATEVEALRQLPFLLPQRTQLISYRDLTA